MTMRIAVFHNLPSGGAKRALHGFVKALSKKGNEIDLFVPSTADENFLSLKPFAKQIMVIPVRRTGIGMTKSTWKYVLPARFSAADLEATQSKLAQVINTGGYDIALVEQDRYTLSPFILKYLRIPSVYFCQQPSRLEEPILTKLALHSTKAPPLLRQVRKIWKAYLRRQIPRIDRENANWAKYILANSEFSRESILKAYGLQALVSHLGVDPEIFRPLQLEAQNYALTVGSMEPSKGYDFLIEAFSRIEERIRPKLMIVSNAGNDRYEGYIQKLAAEKGVLWEHKRLISDEDLVRLYNQAKVFVYTPYSEPLGLAALEAMACGTPVVAVAEGGIRDTVLDGETGILTERDPKAFATATETLLADQTRRETLSRKALISVKNYWTIQHAAKRLMDHMQRAMELQKIS